MSPDHAAIGKVRQRPHGRRAQDHRLADLRKTTPQLPRITRNVAEAADALPLLLLQTQETTAELEILLRYLQANWLIGGGRAGQAPSTGRISPTDVRP